MQPSVECVALKPVPASAEVSAHRPKRNTSISAVGTVGTLKARSTAAIGSNRAMAGMVGRPTTRAARRHRATPSPVTLNVPANSRVTACSMARTASTSGLSSFPPVATDHDGWALRPPVAEDESATSEGRVGEHGIGVLGGVRRHDGVVLWPGRLDEDVLDVEGDGPRPSQAGPIGEALVEVLAVVEVGVIGQGHVARPGGGHDVGCSPRTYRSELRQRQAHETRLRVVAAAAELFAALGYARTTLAKIAAAAGVSVETVQAQGSKAALMIALGRVRRVRRHRRPQRPRPRRRPALRRASPIATRRSTSSSPSKRRSTSARRAQHRRCTAPPPTTLSSTATSASSSQASADRSAGSSRSAPERGWLRDDIAFDELVETAVVISSMETYIRMVHRDGWTLDAYRNWFRRMLDEAVLTRTPAGSS